MGLEEVEGDLLDSTAQYLAHQCNCVTKKSLGLSAAIFGRFPHAECYATAEDRTPGTISVRGGLAGTGGPGTGRRGIINIFAQHAPGAPRRCSGHGHVGGSKVVESFDSAAMRLRWFTEALADVGRLQPRPASVAFPYGVGCGLAGGSWPAYRAALATFAEQCGIRVVLVRQGKGGRGGRSSSGGGRASSAHSGMKRQLPSSPGSGATAASSASSPTSSSSVASPPAAHRPTLPHPLQPLELGRGLTVHVAHGEPIVDRGSVFLASLAFPIDSQFGASAALVRLGADARHVGSDHRMTAYRFVRGEDRAGPSVDGGGMMTGKGKRKARRRAPEVVKEFDDDGETNGGRRLLGMLSKEGAVGVAVLVSRVYGGVNLGKARFEHIMRAGRTLLLACGHEKGVPLRKNWVSTAGTGLVLGGESGSGKLGKAVEPSSGCKRSRLLSMFAAQKQQEQAPRAARACVPAAAAPPAAPGARGGGRAGAGGRGRGSDGGGGGGSSGGSGHGRTVAGGTAAAPASAALVAAAGVTSGETARVSVAAVLTWACAACTFRNAGTGLRCEICETDRPASGAAAAAAAAAAATVAAAASSSRACSQEEAIDLTLS